MFFTKVHFLDEKSLALTEIGMLNLTGDDFFCKMNILHKFYAFLYYKSLALILDRLHAVVPQ